MVKKKKSIHKCIFTPSVITFRLLMVSINVIFAAAFPSKSYILALVGSIAGIQLEVHISTLVSYEDVYFQEMAWCNIVADSVVVVVGIVMMSTVAISSVLSSYLKIFSVPR